ncbi:PREDICTED: zinc finger CCCH domain-containing protein 55-like isoform X7 [Populus euphratica]|uniref:Zinc finger CCCH domain-containing protein 55-like isoform X7 n=1 Tax=Populus euphratica TaxID=75702 RepID=A0AAJ6Y7J3_POPEU|nr:PREDICTED: zinc finger CCCH domain-containing protein 55-like isoform X7 [Populus euphratica]
MDTHEITNILLTKLKSLDPENASRIMGFILIQDPTDKDLLRLAFGPETLLQNVVFKAKIHLGLSANTLSTPSTPSSPSPLNPIARPCNNTNPFPQASPRITNSGSFLDFSKNPSPNPWSVHGLPNKSDSKSSISPKSSPFLSYDNIRSGTVLVSPFSRNGGNGGGVCSNNGADFLGEYQSDDHLSFLDDPSSQNEDFMDQTVQLGGYSVANGDVHLHRRRFSESDACSGAEDGGFGLGYRPCLYFARGFCKNGESCKFGHGDENMAEVNGGGALVSSPREIEELYLQQQEEMMERKAVQQQQEEMMKMKAVQQQQQQRLAYNKHMNFLLLQQNEAERIPYMQDETNMPHRFGAAMMGDEFYKFGRTRGGRNDFLAMGMAEKANSASRQIYLTFPADSSFKDEDVSNYFSSFGPVQDVRIPYQQKRMFGFVTFVYPETVKEILAKGNPHYICESRVLVKPYKEKGKVAKNRTQQLLGRGGFSPASSPSGFDPRELCDLHLGARMLYNTPEMMLRRKLEEQAELQQAIELQGRRLINLQLPDLRGDHAHHNQHSLSVGAPISLPTHHTPINQTDILTSDGKNEITLEENLQDDVNAACIQNNDTVNCKAESFTESHGSNLEHDSLTKSSENQHPDMFPSGAEVEESNELYVSSCSENDASVPSTSTSNEASN